MKRWEHQAASSMLLTVGKEDAMKELLIGFTIAALIAGAMLAWGLPPTADAFSHQTQCDPYGGGCRYMIVSH